MSHANNAMMASLALLAACMLGALPALAQLDPGSLVGGGFGLFLGIAASTDNSGWWEVGVEDVAVVTAIVGATGAGIGALIGAASKRDRWEPVPLSPRVAR